MTTNPFTDTTLIPALYADPVRLERRTRALHAAKIAGPDAAVTTARLAASRAPMRPRVLDVGCGRGTTTLHLARTLRPRRLVAVDQSGTLLAAARARLRAVGLSLTPIRADFHTLPFAPGTFDVAVAAFCLYHSARPEHAIAELARCLAPGGLAVLVTKSADSYDELDHLLATTGLAPDARRRPSLYESCHSGNLANLAAASLRLVELEHQRHAFAFEDADHLAAYLMTSPRYTLPGDAAVLTAMLRERVPAWPVTTTSTVTYLVGTWA
jgi:SAM-dependent methyltransferase